MVFSLTDCRLPSPLPICSIVIKSFKIFYGDNFCKNSLQNTWNGYLWGHASYRAAYSTLTEGKRDISNIDVIDYNTSIIQMCYFYSTVPSRALSS